MVIHGNSVWFGALQEEIRVCRKGKDGGLLTLWSLDLP